MICEKCGEEYCSAEFAEGHRIGYEAGIRAAQVALEKGDEIAAIKLPIPASLAAKIMGLIGRSFKGARMEQRGSWCVFFHPNE
jgi:hypothetical protein